MLVTVGLLIFVATRIDWPQLKGTFRDTKWLFLFLTLLLNLLAFWLRSVKLWYILKMQKCSINTHKIFSASVVSTLYGMALPNALDTGIKWYILKRHAGEGTRILSSMFYGQVTEIVFMLLLGFSALLITNPGGGWHIPVISLASLFIVIVFCFLMLNRTIGTWLNAVFGRLFKFLPSKVKAKGQAILEQLYVFQIARWQFHLNVALLTLAATIASFALFIFAALAANINVPLAVIAWQTVLIYILGRLPISVANLGVREVTLIESLAVYSVSASAALLMSMVIFSNSIFIALVGAGYQLFWTLKSEKLTSPPDKKDLNARTDKS